MVRNVRAPSSDHAAFMSYTFAAKQVEHFGTLGILVDAERYADAQIIARVMLEGAALLDWALKEPAVRPKEWCAFALVLDLRLLREKQNRGESIPDGLEQDLRERLCNEAGRFMKKGESDPLSPGSYVQRWPRLTASELVAKYDPGLGPIYAGLSSWVHWSPRGIGEGVERDGDRVRIDWSNRRSGTLAMASGFQSCGHTCRLLAKHCNLPQEGDLQALLQECVEAVA